MQTKVVEIFKTNVCCELRAKEILADLNFRFPDHHLNFDLEDCDKVLRVESDHVDPDRIISALAVKNIQSELIA